MTGKLIITFVVSLIKKGIFFGDVMEVSYLDCDLLWGQRERWSP